MPDYDLPGPSPTSVRYVWLDGRAVDVAAEVLPLAASLFSRPELANPEGSPPELQTIHNLCLWMKLDLTEETTLTEGLVAITDFWVGLPRIQPVSMTYNGLTVFCAERFDGRGADALTQTIQWVRKHTAVKNPIVWILPPGGAQ